MYKLQQTLNILGGEVDTKCSVLIKDDEGPEYILRLEPYPRNVYTNEQAIVKIDDVPYVTTSGKIYFCEYTELWTVRNAYTINMLTRKGEMIEVQFSPLVFPLVYDKGDIYAVEDVDLAKELGFEPYGSSTFLWSAKKVDIPNDYRISGLLATTSIHKLHQCSVLDMIITRYNKSNNDFSLAPELNALVKLAGDYTFGIEYETSYSSLPDAYCCELGLVKVKDGSLPSSGAEYASIPLSGAKGINATVRAIKLLSNHCKIDLSCSLHISIGGFNMSEKFLVALYYLYYRVQHEILDFLPFYLHNTVAIARKDKIYSDTLPDLGFRISKSPALKQEQLDNIYDRLCALYRGSTNKNSKPGWKDRSWNHAGRYYALNMARLFVGGDSVEFRIFPPSLLQEEIINYLSICLAIVRVAENNIDYIINCITNREKLSLYDVIIAISNENFSLSNNSMSEIELNELSGIIMSYIDNALNTKYQQEAEAINVSSEKGQSTKYAYYRQIAQAHFNKQGINASSITQPTKMTIDSREYWTRLRQSLLDEE